MQITEEFRRFRVRAEISRKQKDAEARQAAAASIVGHQRRINGEDLEGELHKAKAEAAQVNSLREELKDQEDKWRSTCDELARENDQLRSQGSEAALAAQWRQRYEQATREKEELSAKLRMGDTAQGGEATSSDAQKSALSCLSLSLPGSRALRCDSAVSVCAPDTRPCGRSTRCTERKPWRRSRKKIFYWRRPHPRPRARDSDEA